MIQQRTGDAELLRVLDADLLQAARRSGSWLVCRPGCASCCFGAFPITTLDALRLGQGMMALATADSDRAARIRNRAAAHNPDRDDEPCPALDPDRQTCDLYASRPVTCRVFGPATWLEDGSVGVCELCYAGATEHEIAACAVRFDPDGLESALLDQLGRSETTVVAAILDADR